MPAVVPFWGAGGKSGGVSAAPALCRRLLLPARCPLILTQPCAAWLPPSFDGNAMSATAGRVKGVNRCFLLTGFSGGCGGQESGGSLATLEGVLPDSSRLSGYSWGVSTPGRIGLTGSASRVGNFAPVGRVHHRGREPRLSNTGVRSVTLCFVDFAMQQFSKKLGCLWISPRLAGGSMTYSHFSGECHG